MFRDFLWSFMMIHNVLWWFMMFCSGLLWFVVVCGGLWWFVVVSLKFSRKYHVTHYLTDQSPRFSIKSHFE